ncbi:sensor histidine kinase [Streptomyces sp. NBC_01465]|uniref:sensor histidine kinase n=1 Tax=Streptomyces sp. NBC_01465 TaxID=2903878 RepID=UPI002E325881|nr:histidine kinase [Streptomyces sp. NBC_01465]
MAENEQAADSGKFTFRGGLVALRRSLTLCGLATVVSLRSLAVSSAVWLIGPGLGLVPAAMAGVRQQADRQRELAAAWSGVEIPGPYGPLPPAPPGARGLVARYRWLFSDPQTRRERLWALHEPLVGGPLAFVPAALLLSGAWGIFLAAYGTQLTQGSWNNAWYLFFPVMGWKTAALAGFLGLVQFPLALWSAPKVVRQHARWTRRVLTPSAKELLNARVKHLAETRSDAVGNQMAEIRRIERDLHDGAQARLVAMGMTLNAAEHRLATDPEAVRELLVEARESSVKALQELRDLVRGIHPPVLADRGLVDAVRALALGSPLTTEVVAGLPGRPDLPVESAAYFAVSEVLTNATKHARADRAWIEVGYDHDRRALRITVTDDGHGGADPARGTGLRGIERRLATFDGVLAVSSPPGGPTLVTMELPCELSSPKTTSS